MRRRRRPDRAAGLSEAGGPGEVSGLSELGGLAERWRREAEQRRLDEQRRRLAERRADNDARLFRESVGEVVALRHSGRIEPQPRSVPTEPRQRELDERAVLDESLSDEIDIERLLETDETLSYRRPGIGADVVRRLRRGAWTVKAQIDLHGLRVDDAREALAAFLQQAQRDEMRCVRVIHGKGLGSIGREPILKHKVPRWLAQRNDVLAFCQARPNDGGAGALIVLLRIVPVG